MSGMYDSGQGYYQPGGVNQYSFGNGFGGYGGDGSSLFGLGMGQGHLQNHLLSPFLGSSYGNLGGNALTQGLLGSQQPQDPTQPGYKPPTQKLSDFYGTSALQQPGAPLTPTTPVQDQKQQTLNSFGLVGSQI